MTYRRDVKRNAAKREVRRAEKRDRPRGAGPEIDWSLTVPPDQFPNAFPAVDW
jgi:hypothetical protein